MSIYTDSVDEYDHPFLGQARLFARAAEQAYPPLHSALEAWVRSGEDGQWYGDLPFTFRAALVSGSRDEISTGGYTPLVGLDLEVMFDGLSTPGAVQAQTMVSIDGLDNELVALGWSGSPDHLAAIGKAQVAAAEVIRYIFAAVREGCQAIKVTYNAPRILVRYHGR